MKSDPNSPGSVSAKVRAYRIHLFNQYLIMSGIKNAHILDIGGTLSYWKMNARYISSGLIKNIDIINLPPLTRIKQAVEGITITVTAGNALDDSSLQKKKYDIVYTNSVIEHVGNLRAQRKLAYKIRTLGKFYWVQTPAKSFPLEPHFYFPWFAYLPLSIRSFFHMRYNLGFKIRNSNWIESRMECEDIRLLTEAEMRHLFKGGSVFSEKFFGVNKSYIATNMISGETVQKIEFLKNGLLRRNMSEP
jgi:hypothetical protein